MSAALHATITPFTFDVLTAVSLGDLRACAMNFGPWEINFHECCGAADTISLDGEPVALHSWDHAAILVGGRPDALRWLRVLRDEAETRAAQRAAGDGTA